MRKLATLALTVALTVGGYAVGYNNGEPTIYRDECILVYPHEDGSETVLLYWQDGEDTGLLYCPTGDSSGY